MFKIYDMISCYFLHKIYSLANAVVPFFPIKRKELRPSTIWDELPTKLRRDFKLSFVIGSWRELLCLAPR